MTAQPRRNRHEDTSMTARKLAPIAVALIMLLPALVVLQGAHAQETVPFANTVVWQNEVNHLQKLYLRTPNVVAGNEEPSPNCLATTGALSINASSPYRVGSRSPCTYSASGGPQGGGTTLRYDLANPLLHAFNVTGNNTLVYEHYGGIGDGISVSVTVRAADSTGADTLVATNTIIGRNDNRDNPITHFTLLLPVTNDAYRFRAGDIVRVDLSSSSATLTDSWEVDDTRAHLEIRSVDAVKTALWTRDELGTARNLFRPLAESASASQRISGIFAVRSAFGFDDARFGGPAVFTVHRFDTAVPLGPGRLTSLQGEFSSTLSQATAGRAVWIFPDNQWDYRGAQGGEYQLLVDKPYHQGSGFRSAHSFFISTQSVVVKPYDDKDPSTFPSPLESLAHDQLPGGSTTYVLLINNTGSANDTFGLTTQLISSSPNAGWTALIGGPNVLNGEVFVPAGQERFVTITTRAPSNTVNGDTAIFQVSATSRLDPLAVNPPVTIVSTVSSTVTTGVDIILRNKEETLEPGIDRVYDVFVWNRGSRASNVSLDLEGIQREGWAINLLLGSLPVKQVQLSNVAPGDIVRAQLRVNGPIGSPFTQNDVTLVATSTDGGGIAKEVILRLILKATAGVKLELKKSVLGVEHYVETYGDGVPFTAPCDTAAEPDSCIPNAPRGTWVRVWVTNTGKVTDNFSLDLDTFDWSRTQNCPGNVFVPRAKDATLFGVFFRNALGAAVARNTVQLSPGETGELYVWRAINGDQQPCNGNADEFFSFVVTATGRDTGAVARDGIVIRAENRDEDRGKPLSLVDIEAVSRRGDYNSDRPLVDITRAKKDSVEGLVEVGQNATYFVRVTNAASWGAYMDGNVRVAPDVDLVLQGVDSDEGWNATMRVVTGETDESIHPFVTRLTLTNDGPNGPEAWKDHEIEVRVRAPFAENRTALAGTQDQFTIVASIPGTAAKDLIEIKTTVTEFANIQARADVLEVLGHPGEPTAFLVYLSNEGSSESNVTLRASMAADGSTINPQRWSVEPSQQAFFLPAFTNQSVAILVTPPSDASPGQTGDVNVTLEYAPNPNDLTRTANRTLRLITQVAAQGAFDLTAASRETTVAPGGFANFSFSLKNNGGSPLQFDLAGSPIPDWTATISPRQGTLAAGDTVNVVYVLQAPSTVKNGTRFASIVRVTEVGNDANFDIVPVHINILGGKPIASISAPIIQKSVDRGGFQNFQVNVKNVGSARGLIPLEVRTSNEQWSAFVTNAQDQPITGISLGPNELARVNVTVRAPLVVPVNTLTNVELSAFSPDYSQSSKATLQAKIHDYGIKIELAPSRVDAVAGLPSEFVLKIRNTGNDNDTLNVSASLVDLPEWSVTFSTDRVFLEKDQETEVRATVQPTKSPLPSPRAYNFRFFGGSIGAQGVNVTASDIVTGTVNVLEYRSLDVDGDGFLELAVDQNKQPGDGFEVFREIHPDGVQSVVVSVGKLNGKARFFLDVPGEQPYDGIADRWFDPERVYSYIIKHHPDLNGDASPDYLIDSDRDREQKVDLAYDTVSQQYWNVVEVKLFGDDRVQFLVDTNGDGRPDRFYDPEGNTVTRTQTTSTPDRLGLDTNDDGRVNKYYDVKTGAVSDAKLRNFGDFASEYWYFFVAFAALLIITIVLVVRRFRG